MNAPPIRGDIVAGRHRLLREQWVPQRRRDVFAFFAAAENLEFLTPSFLHFRIMTPPPIVMAVGTTIEYRLRLYGVPVHWRTRIERFTPESSFVDLQIAGPYARWHHLHEFEERDGGTLIRDVVDYTPGFAVFGRLAHPVFVKPALTRIFDYRQDRISERFGGPRPAAAA